MTLKNRYLNSGNRIETRVNLHLQSIALLLEIFSFLLFLCFCIQRKAKKAEEKCKVINEIKFSRCYCIICFFYNFIFLELKSRSCFIFLRFRKQRYFLIIRFVNILEKYIFQLQFANFIFF